jgi:hypothetical protein
MQSRCADQSNKSKADKAKKFKKGRGSVEVETQLQSEVKRVC